MKLDLAALNEGIASEYVKSGMMSVGMPAASAVAAPVAKAAIGTVGKYAPVVGGLVHGGFAVNDALKGDWTGAAMNAGAGLAAGFGLTPLAVGLDVANAGRAAVGGLRDMAVNTAGKYAPLAMAGVAALGSRRNNAQQPQMAYNQYRGARPQSILNTTNMDPHSLAAPQMFTEKLAAYLQKKAGLGDALANAASRKVIDSVFDTAAAPPVDRASQVAKEKEIELTSKYPEIEKMLQDEQNKAYLEKLLNA
jgi:hypothetical protein